MLVFFMVLWVHKSHAQQNNTLYFMQSVPQASYLNPALSIPCNYLGLPLISSFYIDIGNTGFSYNQLFPIQGSSRIVDFTFLEKNLHRLDLMNFQLHTDLFSLGWWRNDYFFTFKITEKVNLFFSYPKQLFLLPWKGNTPYVGETVEISRAGIDFHYYREYALSASTWIRDHLKLGVRAGLLFGKLNLHTHHENFSIHTQAVTHNLDISGRYSINASAPLRIAENDDGTIKAIRLRDELSIRKMLLNRKNPGFKLDAGFMYDGVDKWSIQGGINDLGLIYWSADLHTAEVKQQYQFEGFEEGDLQNSDIDEFIVNTLYNSYETTLTHKPYITMLPLKTYFGAAYRANKHLRTGILQRNLLYNWHIYPSLVMSLNVDVTDFLSLSGSYAYNKHSFRNFGAGIALQNNRMQFYMVTDNLSAVRPLDAKNINILFGFNLFFGCSDNADERYDARTPSSPGCFWIERRLENEKILP